MDILNMNTKQECQTLPTEPKCMAVESRLTCSALYACLAIPHWDTLVYSGNNLFNVNTNNIPPPPPLILLLLLLLLLLIPLLSYHYHRCPIYSYYLNNYYFQDFCTFLHSLVSKSYTHFLKFKFCMSVSQLLCIQTYVADKVRRL